MLLESLEGATALENSAVDFFFSYALKAYLPEVVAVENGRDGKSK